MRSPRGWPNDPPDVAATRADPQVFAGNSVGDVAAYQQMVIERLDREPAIIGHSFGGVLVQMLAGRGLSAATCAISPAPSRGVLPLPVDALKASSAVLSNPANRHRAVTLTYDQFRFGFANAVPEEDAHDLYEQFHVAGRGFHCSRPPSPTSTQPPRSRPTRRTPLAGPCWSSPGRPTIRRRPR